MQPPSVVHRPQFGVARVVWVYPLCSLPPPRSCPQCPTRLSQERRARCATAPIGLNPNQVDPCPNQPSRIVSPVPGRAVTAAREIPMEQLPNRLPQYAVDRQPHCASCCPEANGRVSVEGIRRRAVEPEFGALRRRRIGRRLRGRHGHTWAVHSGGRRCNSGRASAVRHGSEQEH